MCIARFKVCNCLALSADCICYVCFRWMNCLSAGVTGEPCIVDIYGIFFTLSVDNRIEITSTSSGGKKDSIILLKNWLIMQQYAGTRYKLTFYEHRLKKNLSCKRATINLIKFPHFYWILTSCWLSVTYSPCSLSHHFLLNWKYDITDKCLDTFILHSNLICT